MRHYFYVSFRGLSLKEFWMIDRIDWLTDQRMFSDDTGSREVEWDANNFRRWSTYSNVMRCHNRAFVSRNTHLLDSEPDGSKVSIQNCDPPPILPDLSKDIKINWRLNDEGDFNLSLSLTLFLFHFLFPPLYYSLPLTCSLFLRAMSIQDRGNHDCHHELISLKSINW